MTTTPAGQRKQRATAIGRLIKDARKVLHFTQDEAAEAITAALQEQGIDETVTQSTVSYWETGRSVPSVDKLPSIERVLDIKPRGEIARLGYLADGQDGDGALDLELAMLRREVAGYRATFEKIQQQLDSIERLAKQRSQQ